MTVVNAHHASQALQQEKQTGPAARKLRFSGQALATAMHLPRIGLRRYCQYRRKLPTSTYQQPALFVPVDALEKNLAPAGTCITSARIRRKCYGEQTN